MNVSGVSESHAYMPVGIICRRPTTAPVSNVGPRRAAPEPASAFQEEIPGPKLLIDLSLIAPRPTGPSRPRVATQSLNPGFSPSSAISPSETPGFDLLA